MSSASKNKINWLLILQGWSMLLVVIGHVAYNGTEMTEPAFSRVIREMIYSFHMPLFMVISGFLFHHTRIARNTPYKKVLKDKFYRLGIPYTFFTVATLCVKPLFNSLMERPTNFGIRELINAFLYPANNPLNELWFIGTLLMLFVLSPLFRLALKNIYTAIGFLLVVTALHFSPWGGEILCTRTIITYSLWFYLGILLSKYGLLNVREKSWLPTASMFMFFALFFINKRYGCHLEFFITLAGISTSFLFARILDRLWPAIFESFRDYTYQIYLTAIFFQWLVYTFYTAYAAPNYIILYYIINILAGLYIPVAITKTVVNSNIKFINPLLGLK